MKNRQRAPGVIIEDVYAAPKVALKTGVPLFLGHVESGDPGAAYRLTAWPHFKKNFGTPDSTGYLADAVRGFFENKGELCFIVPLPRVSADEAMDALNASFDVAATLDTIDLVCTPDIVLEPEGATERQQRVLDYCQKSGDRMAILDSEPNAAPVKVAAQRAELHGDNGALYYPWVQCGERFVPPCGHVAGVYARSDRRIGVHKAPANESLYGVLDLQKLLDTSQQAGLNDIGVNCLRAFPGRGIRVWGARTLSDDPEWRYINVRRLFLTVGRWIEATMVWTTFEPNDPQLWARVRLELSVFFTNLHRQGALLGQTPDEAFYVKCDEETNSSDTRQTGRLVTEIGLAAAAPNEMITVRLIHDASGISIESSTV